MLSQRATTPAGGRWRCVCEGRREGGREKGRREGGKEGGREGGREAGSTTSMLSSFPRCV